VIGCILAVTLIGPLRLITMGVRREIIWCLIGDCWRVADSHHPA